MIINDEKNPPNELLQVQLLFPLPDTEALNKFVVEFKAFVSSINNARWEIKFMGRNDG